MTQSTSQVWLHRFAVLTALATLGLVVMGGLVTSHGVGMSVPDWPTSYGYNMFALPVSTWLTGGIFHEHTHRLWASEVGILTIVLCCWLFGKKSRLVVRWLGVLLIVAGLGGLHRPNGLQSSIHIGVHGIALLVASFFWRVEAAPKHLRWLGVIAVLAVLLQGLLGGLRVVLDAQVLADVRLGTAFGIVHGCLGQAFLVLTAAIALMTSKRWQDRKNVSEPETVTNPTVSRLFVVTTILIFLQLMIGATMRHQHAGLAIPDFPLAYGKVWPDTSTEAVAQYNQQRVEITAANAITPSQIWLQMLHRITAAGILAAVVVVVWATRRFETPSHLRRLGMSWLGLILVQVALGAWTIWSNKAADVATAHVLVGALSLVTGVFGCIISFRRFTGAIEAQSVPKSTGTYAQGAPVIANP